MGDDSSIGYKHSWAAGAVTGGFKSVFGCVGFSFVHVFKDFWILTVFLNCDFGF